jgi:hypothetical protein
LYVFDLSFSLPFCFFAHVHSRGPFSSPAKFVACEDLSGDEESTDDVGWVLDEDAEEEDGFGIPEHEPDKESKTLKNTGNNRTECICAQEGILCSQNPVLVTKTVVDVHNSTRTSSKKSHKTDGTAQC